MSTKFSNQMNWDEVPNASSCRNDCSSACEAGQMKNTRVTTIWGATSR